MILVANIVSVGHIPPRGNLPAELPIVVETTTGVGLVKNIAPWIRRHTARIKITAAFASALKQTMPSAMPVAQVSKGDTPKFYASFATRAIVCNWSRAADKLLRQDRRKHRRKQLQLF